MKSVPESMHLRETGKTREGPPPRAFAGFTAFEVLTALVVVGVLAAIAIPSWRSHLLKTRRGDAIAALIAVQKAQDQYFGRHARYAVATQLAVASPGGLGLGETSAHGYYGISLQTSADGLDYRATARALAREGQSVDARCAEFTIDHNGQRRATDAAGADRSADCWR
jgi:type IV pilus assembly protein PilE